MSIVPADAQQAVDQVAAPQEVQPARPARLADDDLRRVVLEGDAHERLGDVVVVRDDDLGAELPGEREVLLEAALVLGVEGGRATRR